MHRVLVLALILACGGSAPTAREPQDGEDTPWCFRFLADDPGPGDYQAAVWCFQYEQSCKQARQRVFEWGHLASVIEVGECPDDI